ncbi:MAG: AraC family transcriptional regulator [Devosia nanyangense]|uniref:AraC family transcriptional regulator n=1 Tax=Devosia nanyangense TaxID=1228055 RepID=A0A933L3C0_9HYPH|nr:AraC family transcriptional regulator [Devosia nanyangense]
MQKTANGELIEKPGTQRGILDSMHAQRNFALRRYYPSAQLAAHIEHYWIVTWDLRGAPAYTAEVLPHPSVNVAFTRDRGWVTGVTTGKYTYDLEGEGIVLGIQFRPGAFRPFLGRPVSTITDQTLPAGEVFPIATEDFRRALLEQSSDEAIVGAGEALLVDRLPAPDAHIGLINDIVALVRDDRSLSQVSTVAERFGLPERTLQHLFSSYVGVGLKWVIRRYRVMEAAELAEAGTAPKWTALAHDLGYSDQAHFTNDFTRIVGRAPSEHARYAARD